MGSNPQTGQALPLAFCESCGREVLLHVDYDADGRERSLCVHCDRPIVDGLRTISDPELGENGYALIEASACGSGGCGSGGCARRES